jgi:hypothetical protein
MVLFVAVSVPIMKPIFESQKPKKAAQTVADALLRIRVRAMEEQAACGILFERYTEGNAPNVSLRMRLLKSRNAYINPPQVRAKVENIIIQNPLSIENGTPITKINGVTIPDNDDITPVILDWKVSVIKLYRYNSTDKWNGTPLTAGDSDYDEWNKATPNVASVQLGRQGRFYKLRKVKERKVGGTEIIHYTLDPPYNNLIFPENGGDAMEFKVLRSPQSSLAPPVVLPRGTVIDLGYKKINEDGKLSSLGISSAKVFDSAGNLSEDEDEEVYEADEDDKKKKEYGQSFATSTGTGDGIKIFFTPAGSVDKFYIDDTEYKPYGLIYFCIGEWDRRIIDIKTQKNTPTIPKKVTITDTTTSAEDGKNNIETKTNFWVTLHPQTGQVRVTEMAPVVHDTTNPDVKIDIQNARKFAAEHFGISE